MEEKLKKIMASVFEVSEKEINEETSPDNLDNWDSLRQLNLVSVLEEEFEVELTEDSRKVSLNEILKEEKSNIIYGMLSMLINLILIK